MEGPHTLPENIPISAARLTESPELLRLEGNKTADCAHPSAFAFSLIGADMVVSTPRTHLFIFNALKAISMPESMTAMQRAAIQRGGPEELLGDYDVTLWPSALTPQDLKWFQDHYTGEMGEMRRRTQSGRAWLQVPVRGQIVSVFSFWVPLEEVAQGTLPLLCERFKLSKLPVLVEFADSTCTAVYSPAERKSVKFRGTTEP